MQIIKSKLEELIKELPEKVEVEDVMYRIYMLQKIEMGEKDIAEGRTFSHEEAMERLSKKWQQ
jgi:predicted transcriptional regulator